MLNAHHIANSLNARKDDFENFADRQIGDLRSYLSILELISAQSLEEISARTAESLGAVPSAEYKNAVRFVVSFDQNWSNHEESRAWAAEVLSKRKTIAVDGSMFYAEKDVTLPVGLVNVGWFVNPHDSGEPYEKNSFLTILTPKDLLEDHDEPLRPETRVSEEMFFAELKKARELIVAASGWELRGERLPVIFLDRPLLLPFSPTQPKIQERFIEEMANLIKFSAEKKVVVIGYVDRGFSRDIINMLTALSPEILPPKPTLYDAALMVSNDQNFSVLQNWGDRTPFSYARRAGFDAYIDSESGHLLVGFVFLKAEASGAARIDIPGWVYESGLLNEVLDIVRAECVIGLGYPYAIETADQTAVISIRDRDLFLKALQEFAKKHNLKFRVSRKRASKGRRR